MLSHIFLPSAQLFLCIQNILEAYITEGYVQIVEYNGNIQVPFIRHDLSEKSGSILLKPNMYVVDIDIVPVEKFLVALREEQSFNPGAKFIFVGEELTSEDLSLLSTFYILNVIFINVNTGNVQRFNPYKQAKLEFIDTNLVTIGHTSNCTGRFFQEYPNSWKGSSIPVCYSFYPPYSICPDCEVKGIGIEIVDVMFEKFGISGLFRKIPGPTENYGEYYRNIFQKKICQLHTSVFKVPEFYCTTAYVNDYLTWFVRAPLEIPRWKYIAEVFDPIVWLFFIISLLFLIFFWYCTIATLGNASKLKIIDSTLRLVLEQSQKFKAMPHSQTILIVLMIFLTYFLSMFFTSRFKYLLSGHNYEKPINSFEEMMEKNLTVGFMSPALRYFQHLPKVMKYFKNHWRLCPMDETCLNETATKTNMATLRASRVFDYVRRRYMDNDGRSKLYKIESSAISLEITMGLPLGHPLSEAIDTQILYLKSHGIIPFFISKYMSNVKDGKMSFDVKELNLSHMVLPLGIWIVGTGVALVVFFSELCISVWIRRKSMGRQRKKFFNRH